MKVAATSAILLLFCLGLTTAFVGNSATRDVARLPILKKSGNPFPKSPVPSDSVRLNAVSYMGSRMESLLVNNRYVVESLEKVSPDMSEVSRLRFAIQFTDGPTAAREAMQTAVTWREGPGRLIVKSAAEAVAKATEGGGWDNDVVRNAAPNANVINKFITPENTLTLPTPEGDLIYVIRAALIDDKELMNAVSVEELSDFFLYAKEVHSLVANARSARTGRLCNVIFANDIVGVRKPLDKRFSKALTSSSSQYEVLYPGLGGPTLILNLPFILQAFVGLFKPLFPKSVQKRLLFKRAPVLANLETLTPIYTNKAVNTAFVNEVKSFLP